MKSTTLIWLWKTTDHVVSVRFRSYTTKVVQAGLITLIVTQNCSKLTKSVKSRTRSVKLRGSLRLTEVTALQPSGGHCRKLVIELGSLYQKLLLSGQSPDHEPDPNKGAEHGSPRHQSAEPEKVTGEA
jgi:hypothetical protein